MKRFAFFILIFFVILTECTRLSVETRDIPSHYQNRISKTDIVNYLSIRGIPQTKSNDFDITPIIYHGDTAMYLVNFLDGWELLSADKRAPMVIMQADNGHMTPDSLFTNPYEELFGKCMSEIIVDLRKDDSREMSDFCKSSWRARGMSSLGEQWILISTDTLLVEQTITNHLTHTRWRQQYPWHQQMPYIAYNYYLDHIAYTNTNNIHCPAGCGPVACAQLLYYLHYKIGVPQKAYGNCSDTYIYYPGAQSVITSSMLNLDPTSYSSSVWDLMGRSSTVANDSTRYSSILLAQMGMLMNSKYSSNATSTNTGAFSTMLGHDFGIYCSTSSTFSFGILYNQIINNELPVLAHINYQTNNNISNEHAILFDACKYNNYLINKNYVVIIPGNGSSPGYSEQRTIQSIYEEELVGINWGYGDSGMFYSGSPKWYNADAILWSAGGHTFNTICKLWYGFHN